jgi:hypothetical protein
MAALVAERSTPDIRKWLLWTAKHEGVTARRWICGTSHAALRFERGRSAQEAGKMQVETLTALAAAGGTAVVQAAGTDAWTGFRQAVARWFGRGDAQREQAELERLDQTAAALETADPTQADRVRISSEAAWHARIEAALERWTSQSASRLPINSRRCWSITSQAWL